MKRYDVRLSRNPLYVGRGLGLDATEALQGRRTIPSGVPTGNMA